MGGNHHGYFLPSEGANNVAYCLFSFSSLAKYEHYRREAGVDPECIQLVTQATEQKFILSYERSSFVPFLIELTWLRPCADAPKRLLLAYCCIP
jgi:hypothetical protein